MNANSESMSECPHCGLRFSSEAALKEGTCPNCGQPLSRTAQPEGNWVGRYFSNLWEATTRPSQFFRRVPRSGGWSGPLAYGLTTHWLGTALSFLEKSARGEALLRNTQQWWGTYFQSGSNAYLDDPVRGWIWGIGKVIGDPFVTLPSILFSAFLIHLAARILAPSGSTTSRYEEALRLVCYGMSPMIFLGIPWVGGWLAPLLTFVVTVSGAQVFYRVGSLRAVLIALFPHLLLLMLITGGIGLLLLLFARLVFWN